MKRRKLLIVDDTPDIREFLLQALTSGYDIVETSQPATARQMLDDGGADCLIVDVTAADREGEALIRWAASQPDAPAILAIKDRGVETSTRLVQLGAYDFIEKPFTVDRLIHTIERAMEFNALRHENTLLQCQVRTNDPVDALVGNSDAAADLRENIRVLASTNSAFLVQGERGTGKKLLVHEMNRLSSRASAPVVRVRCSSVPESVLMNELFGEERTASGSGRLTTPGRIEVAHGGTLLLEDVDQLPPTVARRIVDFMERGCVQRVAGTGLIDVDVRVAATTTRDLARETARARFNDTLFSLLSVISIDVPPLRERREDVPSLVHYFIDELTVESGSSTSISEESMQALTSGYWGGNVRELRAAVERAYIFAAGGAIEVQHLSFDNGAGDNLTHMEQTFRQGSIREMEKLMILDRLDLTDQNRTRAAKTLDISVRTLRNKLREYRESGTPSLVGAIPQSSMANEA